MTPTQKNNKNRREDGGGRPRRSGGQWQLPENAPVYPNEAAVRRAQLEQQAQQTENARRMRTPGQRSFRTNGIQESAGKISAGQAHSASHGNEANGRKPAVRRREGVRPYSRSERGRYSSAPSGPASRGPGRSGKRRRPLSFREALKEELLEDVQGLSVPLQIDSESIARVAVCTGFIIVLVLLQTTFFARFRPFGAIPDVMLALAAAIAVSEGEKYGAVCGLVCGVLTESLGSGATTPHLLPLLYTEAGFAIGVASKYYLTDSVPVRAVYIAACGFGRAVISAICAACTLDATIGQILSGIVVPEFFATLLLAPGIHALVWLCLRPFHKSREQRTEPRGG